MNKTIKAAVVAALMTMGAAAYAGTVTATSATVNNVTKTPTSVISVPAFDTSLGTLTGAQITVYSTIAGSLKAENASSSAVDTTVSAGGLVTLTSGSFSYTATTVYGQTFHLSAADYDVVNDVPDWAGTGGKTLTFTGQLVTATSALYTGSDLAAFSSTSPLSFSIRGEVLTAGDGNADYLGKSTVNARVAVTYTYTTAPVPEPETYGMLLAGLGLMGVIARRKAKKAA